MKEKKPTNRWDDGDLSFTCFWRRALTPVQQKQITRERHKMNLIERVKKHTSSAVIYVLEVTAKAAQAAADSDSVALKALFLVIFVSTVVSVAVVTTDLFYVFGRAIWGVFCP